MKKIKIFLLTVSILFGIFFASGFSVDQTFAFTNPVIGERFGGNPEEAGEGQTFVNYFVIIWQAFITVGAILVLVYFLWGALSWIISGGDSSRVEKARNRITHALMGLIILVSSFVIIEFISGLFFGDEFSILNLKFNSPIDEAGINVQSPHIAINFNYLSPPIVSATTLDIGTSAQLEGLPGTEDYVAGDGEAGFGKFLSQILTIVMTIAALMVLIYFLWGAFTWITSGGDKSKTESARNRITQSIVGLIVLASAVAIFAMMQSFLGLEVLTFGSGL